MEQLLEDGLVALIETVQTVAPLVWEVYVRQQIMYGVVGLFVAITGLIMIAIMIYYRDDIDGSDKGMSVFFSTIIFTIAVMPSLSYALLHIFNPQYYAIKALLEVIS